jgi:hypothetical protein
MTTPHDEALLRKNRTAATAARHVRWAAALLLAVGMTAGAGAWAQEGSSTQIWGNVTLGFPKSERLHLELDFEPKVQVSGEEPWRNIDTTPLLEFYPTGWLDLTAEATVGFTHQLSGLNTFELTPRIGVRVHLFRNVWEHLPRPERLPGTRLSLGNLLRLESRHFWYSGDQESSQEWRLRNRTEVKVALNNGSLSQDGTLYLIADAEFYVPLGDETPERFSTKFRGRAGLGYRFDYRKRLEFLYIRDNSRSTLEEDFEEDANIFDFRLKIFF